MKILSAVLAATFLTATFFTPAVSRAQSPVTLAGVAYSGDAKSLDDRFAYSRRYEAQLKARGESGYQKVRAAVAAAPPQKLQVTAEQVGDLKGRDQAVVVSLVLNSETVSVEEFGELRKLFVLIRGQALFFDFKSMTVLRSYPLSFAYIDAFNRPPTPDEVLERVRAVYEGAAGKPGLYARFANVLSTATLPSSVPRFLQVSNVKLGPELMAALPAYLKDSPKTAETWAADLVSEAISTRVGVPVIPFTKGYAIGNVMSVQVADGEVYTLTLPKPDYEINVDFTDLKKVKYGEVAGGASYIYGSFATVRIEEPVSNTVYLNSPLKNGAVKVVPRSQNHVDDFPAFYDSINGLFGKLAEAIAGKGNAWVKTAAGAPDIEAQILKTKELMNLCK